MRILLLPLLIYSFSFPDYHSVCFSFAFNDTSGIRHVLDGNTSEWPKRKFEVDNETNTLFASDNDDKFLFVAIRISDQEMQKKVVAYGMNLYIDAKGKKKETKGVEFPVPASNANNPENSLANMKLFGFTTLQPFAQSIQTEGTVNIATTWDSLNVFHIEYNIPIAMLGEVHELKDKRISIGWKWIEEAIIDNKASGTPANPGYVTTTIVGVPAGRSPNSRPPTPGPGRVTDPTPPSVKTQSIWTAHTINF